MNHPSKVQETHEGAGTAISAPVAMHEADRGAHPARRSEAIEPLALRHELRDFDRFPIAPLLKAGRPHVYRQCVETMARTREFLQRVEHAPAAQPAPSV